jgi:hypothetical protein
MKNYLLLFTILSFNAFSQSSVSILDFNNVAAKLTNSGVLFQNNVQGLPSYEVPKNSGLNVIYSSSFWIGATDSQGDLHLAAMRFSGFGQDYFPGPYSSTNSYNDSVYIQKYNQSIWTITRSEIDSHIINYLSPGYTPVPSLVNWPGNGDVNLGVVSNLAPFVDLNSDNIYNPMDGDYPDIRGDISSYIILNDAKSSHTFSGGTPLEIELHIMASQYAGNNFLDTTTFLNVRVFNRGNQQFSTVKFGMYMDADIGNYTDDYFGCAPNKDMIYFYNGDNFDDNNGYGINPPALGVVSLSKPMVTCGYYISNFSYPYTDPQTDAEYWNFMSAQWANGEPWTLGGLGYSSSTGGTTTPTNFIFDGNPATGVGWSELTNNNPAGDRRGIMVMESTSLFPNEMTCYDMAIIYSCSGGNNLQNVQTLIETADSVKQFYLNQTAYNCFQITASTNEMNQQDISIFPNPSKGEIIFENLVETEKNYWVELIDVSGNLVYKTELQSNKLILDLPNGLYVLKLSNGEKAHFKKIIIDK